MLVLDIETTGLPQTKGYNNYYSPKEIQKYNSSRIVSIALLNDEIEHYHIIKPIDFTIKNSHFHGISQENALKKGISLQEFFGPSILRSIEKSDFILGHNIDFDINVLLSELYRQELYGIYYLLEKKNRKCSMKMGKDYFKLQKMPKLVELYFTFFYKPFENQHNALSDARACYDCYKKML